MRTSTLMVAALAVVLAGCSENPRGTTPEPVHKVPGIDEVQDQPTSPDDAHDRYRRLKTESTQVDGMYVNGDGKYVALIKDADAADDVRKLGFVPEVCDFCETKLNTLSDDIAQQWASQPEFSSTGVDLSIDRVLVTLTQESPLAKSLRSEPGVRVTIDPNRATVAQ